MIDGQYAKVIADSINENGVRITTLEVNFWRAILAECNTHRVISKNTSSTRAIPIKSAIKQLWSAWFKPVWTKKQPGMMANEPIESWLRNALADTVWFFAFITAIMTSWCLDKIGVSKQYAGRILEPFQYTKAVWTATEWNNFLHLRDHEAAQPEIRDLAQKIRKALDGSKPTRLNQGEWHLPYYQFGHWIRSLDNPMVDVFGVSLSDARDISASCCAQVSYRKSDDSLEKAKSINGRLIPTDGSPVHASPFEHQATPITKVMKDSPKGFHLKYSFDDDTFWSGNFRDWYQYRQLIKGNVIHG